MNIVEELKNLKDCRSVALEAEKAFEKALQPLRETRIKFEAKVGELLFSPQRQSYMLRKINVHSRRVPKSTKLTSEFLYDFKNGFVVVFGNHPDWRWDNGGTTTKCGFIFPFDSLEEIAAVGGNDVIQKYWASDVHEVIALGIVEEVKHEVLDNNC